MSLRSLNIDVDEAACRRQLGEFAARVDRPVAMLVLVVRQLLRPP